MADFELDHLMSDFKNDKMDVQLDLFQPTDLLRSSIQESGLFDVREVCSNIWCHSHVLLVVVYREPGFRVSPNPNCIEFLYQC